LARERAERGMEAAKRLERHLEEITTTVITKDTMTHMVNAGLEIIQATNAAMKQMNIPPETKNRIHRAEKEALLAVKSAVDVVLREIDKEMPGGQAELKKIEIKQAKKPKRKSK